MNDPKDKTVEIILKQLDKIENKVDKLDGRMDASEKVAIKQEQNLAEHMRRTLAAEQAHAKLQVEVQPLLKVHNAAWGVIKVLGAVSFLAGLIAAILNLTKP